MTMQRTDGEKHVLGLGSSIQRSEANGSARQSKAVAALLRLEKRVRKLAIVHVEHSDRPIATPSGDELAVRREPRAKHFGRAIADATRGMFNDNFCHKTASIDPYPRT